jgi:hypothetical protein
MRPPVLQALLPASKVIVKVCPLAPTEAALGTMPTVPSPPTGVRVGVGVDVGVGVGTETFTVGWTAISADCSPKGSLSTRKTLLSGAPGAVAPGPPPIISP